MMGVLDEEFKKNLAELIIYFIDNNIGGMINQQTYMGMIDEQVDTKSLKIRSYRYDVQVLWHRVE